MHGVRADAPWCPWNIEFIRRVNGLDSVDDVRRTVFDASYLVLGLGDVYLGAPVATPLDPRHRLVTTKYNPARTWTAENSVGIGGAYLCIYGMEGPGGYQFVGRTVQVWNRHVPRAALHPAVAAAHVRPAALVPRRRRRAAGAARRAGARRARHQDGGDPRSASRPPALPRRQRRRDRRLPRPCSSGRSPPSATSGSDDGEFDRERSTCAAGASTTTPRPTAPGPRRSDVIERVLDGARAGSPPAVLIGAPLCRSRAWPTRARSPACDPTRCRCTACRSSSRTTSTSPACRRRPAARASPFVRRPPTRRVVARLRAAGAIVVGKTNLDQFATGLVGTRSPYGTPPNVLRADLVPGGSSSGSAVAVALGAVPFSIGTDTAGSGRVPGRAQRHRRAEADARQGQHGRDRAGGAPPRLPVGVRPLGRRGAAGRRGDRRRRPGRLVHPHAGAGPADALAAA